MVFLQDEDFFLLDELKHRPHDTDAQEFLNRRSISDYELDEFMNSGM